MNNYNGKSTVCPIRLTVLFFVKFPLSLIFYPTILLNNPFGGYFVYATRRIFKMQPRRKGRLVNRIYINRAFKTRKVAVILKANGGGLIKKRAEKPETVVTATGVNSDARLSFYSSFAL